MTDQCESECIRDVTARQIEMASIGRQDRSIKHGTHADFSSLLRFYRSAEGRNRRRGPSVSCYALAVFLLHHFARSANCCWLWEQATCRMWEIPVLFSYFAPLYAVQKTGVTKEVPGDASSSAVIREKSSLMLPDVILTFNFLRAPYVAKNYKTTFF